MEAQANKKERIDLRVSARDKKIIKKAQKLSGDRSCSSFIVRVVKKEAQEIVAKNDLILATEKDRQYFFDAVYANTKPNQKLLEAADRYKSEQS